MIARRADSPLILVVGEGATGSRASSPLESQPLITHLIDEFDIAVLDTDDRGELRIRTHFGGGPGAIAGAVDSVTSATSGDLLDDLDNYFGDDKPEIVHVQPGASSLYKLPDVLEAWAAAIVVSVDGWQEATSVCRRWADRLTMVGTWVVDSAPTMDYLKHLASEHVGDHVEVIEPGTDLVPRFDVGDAAIDDDTALRLGIVAGRSAHNALVRAERLAALLDDGIEIHLFGAAPGASRQRVICHHEVPDELLTDAFCDAAVHLVEVGDGRWATMVRHAAMASGAALLTAPTGTAAELIRLSGAGWIVDPSDLPATARLLGTLARHRFELRRGMLSARAIKSAPHAVSAAHLAEQFRELVREQ